MGQVEITSNRNLAFNGGAVHFTAITVMVVEGVMQATAIVPYGEAVLSPPQAAGERCLGDMAA